MQVFRHGPHHGEEPPVSGTRGSGAVFFSRCTLACIYCQNHPWSQKGHGDPCTPSGLADILRSLAESGCHNWNLVSPTPWLPWIRESLDRVLGDGFSLPVVYNTSGFERVETLRDFAGTADVFLTDLRYAREETAREASLATGYVQAARAALLEMWRQTGPLEIGEDGAAVSGTICRLLILPGRADEAAENLRWLARSCGTRIAVSVMAQYLPLHRAADRPGWDRRITYEEYDLVYRTLEDLEFTTGWIQDFNACAPRGLVGEEMNAGHCSDGEPREARTPHHGVEA